MLTNEDIQDMRLCGKVGKSLYPFHKVWYCLKERLLELYGYQDGYDLQIWYDKGYSEYGDDPEETLAEHCHILKRYTIQIDEWIHVFHIPTNEFFYFDFETQYEKSSENYDKYYNIYKNKMIGKRERVIAKDVRLDGWKSLKKLIRKYRYLIRYPYLSTINKVLA